MNTLKFSFRNFLAPIFASVSLMALASCTDGVSTRTPEDSSSDSRSSALSSSSQWDSTQSDFPSARIINSRLSPGINLGNALDAPSEGEWGVTLQASYFADLADSGFATVRIPVRWSAHTTSDAPYTIDSVFMNRVVWAVDQALENNLQVVLNIHHYEAIMQDPAGEEARFLAMWDQIAARFASYPPTLLLEVLNEPRDALTSVLWNALIPKAIEQIRRHNPRRTLVVGTAEWGGLAGLRSLELPDDSLLIVTVHYYEPLQFTHQGAPFVEGAGPWLGTLWRANELQRRKVNQDLQQITTWGSENHRPLFMGEFGSIVLADTLSRAWYTEYMVRQMDSLGISWALWNFSSDFGVYDDSTGNWRAYMMQALLRPGSDPGLDSALEQVSEIDLAVYTVLEDYEDNYKGFATLYTNYRLSQDLPMDTSAYPWYFYHSDESHFTNATGDTLWDYLRVRDGKPANAEDAEVPCGTGNTCGHYKAYLEGENYPFAGFGFSLTGRWDSTWHNLCDLTALHFRAKGSGEWGVQLIADTVNSYPTGQDWGFFTTTFVLSNTWQEFIIPREMLQPKPYSVQAAEGMAWEDQCSRISSIEFMNGQSYGANPSDSLEILLDDLRIVGLEPSHFGIPD